MFLQQGDFIYLHKSGDQDKTKKKYRCKVESIEEKFISVTYPVDLTTSKTEFFVDGTQFNCEFTNQNQQAFEFHTTVLGRVRDQIPLLIIENPGKERMRKIQRREFLRVESSLDIAIHPLENEFAPFVTTTLDISAGGTAVILHEVHRIEQGKNVIVWISLPMISGEVVYIKTICKVIRIIIGEQNKPTRAPLQFIDLDEKDQQKITKYCFEQQVSYRKKGLVD